uniref:Uncharacterized protein n=1 Tax=Knipowitschia caucasica TaxID=637954 RepID=A0AAV2MI83_KNICA
MRSAAAVFMGGGSRAHTGKCPSMQLFFKVMYKVKKQGKNKGSKVRARIQCLLCRSPSAIRHPQAKAQHGLGASGVRVCGGGGGVLCFQAESCRDKWKPGVNQIHVPPFPTPALPMSLLSYPGSAHVPPVLPQLCPTPALPMSLLSYPSSAHVSF